MLTDTSRPRTTQGRPPAQHYSQCCAGGSSQCNKKRKTNEKNQD